MLSNKQLNIKEIKIIDLSALNDLESMHRNLRTEKQLFPWAQGTSYYELATVVFPEAGRDLDKKPLYFVRTEHRTDIGIREILENANNYIQSMPDHEDFQALSISADLQNDKIALLLLVKSNNGKLFNFSGFFSSVHDELVKTEEREITELHGELYIPEDIKKTSTYTPEELREYTDVIKQQNAVKEKSSKDRPFLNNLNTYYPQTIPKAIDSAELLYKVDKKDATRRLKSSAEQFEKNFNEIMRQYGQGGPEYYSYIAVIREESDKNQFMSGLEDYVRRNYCDTNELPLEDLPEMMKKLDRNLFALGVIQDLIDDPIITDIKITGFDEIRVRVKGLAYISNTTFVDMPDYLRFVDMILNRCHKPNYLPEQTFTYKADDNYALRITITANYITSMGWPYVHIRKISRKKMMASDLISAGMFDEKVMRYLLDCGRHSRGVVFAGPPGSGKTIALNWFLEDAYEQSAEILVIQENDELFAYRKGVMFQHVVNYPVGNEEPVSLEELGQLALVAGANVFVIGEAKGPEICSAMTLSNSGCRTAITIHSNSATEVVEKMADLAMRGLAKDMSQARKMLTSFQTIVYMESFKVKEIVEIAGYDSATDSIKYNYIYKNPYFDKEEG